MEKQYIAIYNYKNYSIYEIQDMIQSYDVRYWHRRQTWESPEEEDIDYKIDISADFNKAVKVACVEFEDDNDEFGKYVEFDGLKFQIYQEGYSWYDLLQSYGWDIFETISGLDNFYSEKQKVQNLLDEWTNSVAANNAWATVYNGEARSW